MKASTRGFLTMVAVAAAGVVALVFGWLHVARTLFVPLQLPGLVSGGIAGIALLGAGALLVMTHLDRAASARRCDELDALLDEAAALVAARTKTRPKRRTK